jgi:hypothetical protein
MTREQLTEMRRRIPMAQRHLAEQEPYGRAWAAMVSCIEALEAQVSSADTLHTYEMPSRSSRRVLDS